MYSFYNKKLKIGQVLVFCGLFWLMTIGARADVDINQQILDLRKQIEDLTKQADQYKGTIAQKQKQGDTLKKQLDILNNQILKLQTSIIITQKNISTAKIQISDLEGNIFDTQADIGKKKQAVGEMISFLYQRDKLSLVAVLLKSSQLSDFTSQAEQVQSLDKKLFALIEDLTVQKNNLEKQKAELEQKKAGLESLNQKQSNQKLSLSGTKVSKDKLLAQTRGQEETYQKMLAEVERKKEEFFNELRGLEDQAIQSGAFIVHVTATSVPPPGTKIFRFPYDEYVLTQGYGMTSYARRGAYGGAGHNGIDMAAGYGSPIRPIGSGSILASGFNNGWGNWVAVRHDGGLVSLYAHMKAPSGLANSSVVATSSIIGYEGSTGNATGSHLHLSIYKDFFTYISPTSGQLYFNYFEGTLNPLDYL